MSYCLNCFYKGNFFCYQHITKGDIALIILVSKRNVLSKYKTNCDSKSKFSHDSSVIRRLKERHKIYLIIIINYLYKNHFKAAIKYTQHRILY
jgi:hypothetical protein